MAHGSKAQGSRRIKGMKNTTQTTQPPSTGSRAALRVGLIGGAVIGLAIAASRLTTDPGLSAMGSLIIVVGLFVVGYYAVRDSGDYRSTPAARNAAISGLMAGLVASLIMVIVSLAQALDPTTQKMVIEATKEMAQRAYTPEQWALLEQNGMSVESIYPFAVAVQLLCCGAGLPLFGIAFATIGGALSAQIHRSTPQN